MSQFIKTRKRTKKNVRKLGVKAILITKNYKLNNAIIICSEARSGSTWLMQVLGSLPRTVMNWEPLHRTEGVVPAAYRFGNRPLITSNNTNKKYKALFKGILTLKKRTDWSIRFLPFKKLITSKYVVTKFVRANSVLPWLVTEFKKNLGRKPILLLRHPITTCISQLKNFKGKNNKSILEPFEKGELFRVPDCINNERYVEHQTYLNTLNTPLERQIGLWCVNNIEVIQHPDTESWITVYYEDLVIHPKSELKKLLKGLNLPYSIDDIGYKDLKKPSRSNFLKEYSRNPTVQLESFLTQLEPAYLEKIQNIFEYFQLTIYNAHSAYPVKR